MGGSIAFGIRLIDVHFSLIQEPINELFVAPLGGQVEGRLPLGIPGFGLHSVPVVNQLSVPEIPLFNGSSSTGH